MLKILLYRKHVNSNKDGSNIRYFSHSRDSWDVNSSKNNSSSRDNSNISSMDARNIISRDTSKSWDPTKANGSNNLVHSRSSRIIIDAGNLRDVAQ